MLPSPLNTEIESLIVVSCEAGGAQILSSLIKNRKFYKKVSFYLQGPAIQIFKAKLGNIDVLSDLSIIESLGKKDFVLVGRSLMCDIEKEATKKANKFHIPNGVFLDHWVNFDSFYMPTAIKNKKDELQYYMPMHVFVGDDYAYDIAEKLYGDIVILESNEYFKDNSSMVDNLLSKVNNEKKNNNCRSCGSIITPQSKFCGNCGTKYEID